MTNLRRTHVSIQHVLKRAAPTPPLKREVAKIPEFSPEGFLPAARCILFYDPEGSLHQQNALSFINMLDCKQAKYA